MLDIPKPHEIEEENPHVMIWLFLKRLSDFGSNSDRILAAPFVNL